MVLTFSEVFAEGNTHLKTCDKCGFWVDGGWCQHMMKLDYQKQVLFEIEKFPDDVRHPAESNPPFGTVGRH